MHYIVEVVFSAALVGIWTEVGGQLVKQIWTLAKVKKPAICSVCKGNIRLKDKAWRPMGNPANRFRRVCDDHFKKKGESRQ